MKFASVTPLDRYQSRRPVELLYLAEMPVNVGDVVVVPIYEQTAYGEVTAVASKREKLTTFKGAVKSIRRVASPKERRAVLAMEKATAAYERASERLVAARKDADAAQADIEEGR